jgi:pimeloyl-ACP methyl ester carboxylesterase
LLTETDAEREPITESENVMMKSPSNIAKLERRNFLAGGAVVAASGLIGGGAPARAESTGSRKTYVLVHGAWHNAQHWQPVARRLSTLGHSVVALDLPGHGLNARFPAAYLSGDSKGIAKEPSPLKDITLDDAAKSVAAAVAALGSGNVVLVGHSVGGAIITRAAELAPERIASLVYLTAFAPVGLPSAAAYGALPEFQTGYGAGLIVANPGDIGAVRINPRGDKAYLQQLHDTYYNDVAYEDFLAFALALTPDFPLSYWIGEPKATAQRWGRIPRTFIRCTQDRALAPAVQDKMIADADRLTPENKFKVETIGSSHSAFASRPEIVAAILEKVGSS